MNWRRPQADEVPLADFYSMKVGRIVRHFSREHFSFWMISAYLFFEYVRPQAIIPAIDFAPWPTVFLALALLGRLVDRDTRWVSDSTNLWITGFMLTILVASLTAIYPEWSWKYFPEMASWFVVYFIVVNVVTTERRLLIFLAIFLLASFKLSLFGARTWIMRGFAFEAWGIQGPPGFFMNSGELSVQMLMAAPVAYQLAQFFKPHLTRLKYWFMMSIPVTCVLTVMGASSRGSQVGLVYQFYRTFLKGRLSIRTLIAVGVVAALGYSLLPDEQKTRFTEAGSDRTSEQRLIYWQRGLEMFQEHPVLGVGYFNFPPYFEQHFPQDIHSGSTQVPHNIFVQVGTDAGTVGLFFFGMLLWRNIRLAREIQQMQMPDKPYAVIARGLLIAFWGFIIAGRNIQSL